MEYLLCILQKDKFCDKMNLDTDLYKLEFTYKEDLGNVRMAVNLYQDEKTTVVEFSRLGGNLMTYYDKVKLVKKDYLSPLQKHYKPEKLEED